MTLNVDIGFRRAGFRLEAKFECGAGITVLFGRSGAGKTSVLNAVAGLLRPDRGRIEVDGRVLYDRERGVDVAVHRRRIGFVFQDARLLPHLSVRQNLLYGHRLLPVRERRIDLGRVVEMLGIERLLDRAIAGLSGGERQRVAIGRALLVNPRLLLMDEPLASLDMPRRAEVLRYIEQLRDDLRMPIVYVSHAIEEVVRLADNLVLLDHGAVMASGTAATVLARPELQAFSGGEDAGALIDAHVSGYDERYGLTTLAFEGGSLIASGVDALIGERVRVRIRARDVALALSPPADISVLNILHGRITAMAREASGAVDVSIAVGRDEIYARVTGLSADRLGLTLNREVYALIKAVSLDRASTGLA
ncbi:MAG: molybdenum ABC transporter ATP-binding protein [Betaproteobacteria bacterium]|nr:MAG: molybdenum ABC transporter ATP-binding protein [Betaproteobacteria bacterium]